MRWICCPSGSLFGVDIDDLFAFEVPKLVRIREAKLGILYYVFVLLIVLYVLVWQIILHHSYLNFKPPLTSVRLTLQQPTRNQCNPGKNECADVVVPWSSLSYCCNASCSRQSDGSCNCPWRGRSYDCSYLDGLEAGLVNSRQILVSTLVKDYEQAFNTSCGPHGCTKMWYTLNTTQFNVVGVEQYTVAIDHSVTEDELGITELAATMNGMLYVDKTGPLQQALCRSRPKAVTLPVRGSPATGAPCYIPPDFLTAENVDIFRVETLLQAMGVALDPHGDVEKTVHYQGMTATLSITYFNVWDLIPGSFRDVQYIYKLVPLLAPYKKSEMARLRYPDLRVKRDVRGILFTVATTGQLGKFYFQTLLITLTTSLTLVAIATILVKHVAIYLLSGRNYYKELIYHTSADFSDVFKFQERTDEELLQILEERRLPSGGTREQWIMRILEDDGRLAREQSFIQRQEVRRRTLERSESSSPANPLVRLASQGLELRPFSRS